MATRGSAKYYRAMEEGSFSAEIDPDLEAVPRRRLLSLPDTFAGTRHYHMHEHHYHVWDQHHHAPGPMHMWSPMGRQQWHTRPWHNECPMCSSRAWAPPWVFEEFPWSGKAGRFSLVGGLLFLLLMGLCRGGRVFMRHIAKNATPALPAPAE